MTQTGNRARALDVIRRFGPIAIKDVAALCSLSIPGATAAIDGFIKDGLLREAAGTDAGPGRPPKLISVNAGYGFVVGIDLGVSGSPLAGFFRADGTLIAKIRICRLQKDDGMAVISRVTERIKAAIDGFGGKNGRLMAVVTGNPGIVDAQTGALRNAAPSISWAHLPVTGIFKAEFGADAITLNDINLSAIGERVCGAGKGYPNSAFLRVDIGLKAGIILNGALYQGETGAAGEIGSGAIIYAGPAAGGPRAVSAESLVSLPAVLRRISDELADHPGDPLYTFMGADKTVTLNHVIKALGTQNSFVHGVIDETGALLGYAAANMAAALDIGLIIVGGDVVGLSHHILRPMRGAAAAVLSPAPTITPSVLGEEAALWGAAHVGLERAMSALAAP